MDKAKRLTKAEALGHWRALPGNTRTPAQTMRKVPYKHEGSTYAQDGIRLTGTREFIDSVLATLKPLLDRENHVERLQLVYSQSTDRESGHPLASWNCYVQVHERGGEAQMLNTYFDRPISYEAVA